MSCMFSGTLIHSSDPSNEIACKTELLPDFSLHTENILHRWYFHFNRLSSVVVIVVLSHLYIYLVTQCYIISVFLCFL